MSDYTLHCGDALQTLRTLASGSVQTCITSPPYYGLRDYGTAQWDGGDPACDHVWRDMLIAGMDGSTQNSQRAGRTPPPNILYKNTCGKCGAKRIDLQIGLEETPELYVARMVDVFREVRRVLRDDGTLWLNIGDSYNGSGGAGGDYGPGGLKEGQPKYPGRNVGGIKPKDLIGIPWMLAFALRADGWWLRQEIIWHKLAPMPESVTDRCTKAHEQVFLLAKSREYYFDSIAIAEPASESTNERDRYKRIGYAKENRDGFVNHLGPASGEYRNCNGTRNKRSVWTLGPESYSGSHYAVMPTKLVEPCILAGTSARGCCAACGAPWERIVERTNESTWQERKANGADSGSLRNGHNASHGNGVTHTLPPRATETLGWAATCTCNADIVPCVVLDPFFGSGTVGAVALKHGRRFVGIDLDARNLELARKRIEQSQPLLFEVTA